MAPMRNVPHMPWYVMPIRPCHGPVSLSRSVFLTPKMMSWPRYPNHHSNDSIPHQPLTMDRLQSADWARSDMVELPFVIGVILARMLDVPLHIYRRGTAEETGHWHSTPRSILLSPPWHSPVDAHLNHTGFGPTLCGRFWCQKHQFKPKNHIIVV